MILGIRFISHVFILLAITTPVLGQRNVEERLNRLEAKLDSVIALLKNQSGEKYHMAVHFIDVGHGDCIFIETPDDGVKNGIYEGYKILIDAGKAKTDRGLKYVIPYLKSLGLKADDTIDYLIVTHAHDDHIGGLPSIYDSFQVNNTLDPGYNRMGSDEIPDTAQINTSYGKFYYKASHEPGSKLYWNLVESGLTTKNGDSLDLGKELKVKVLYSNPDVDENHINNSSIVLRIQYRDASFLLMGDAEGKERGEAATSIKYVEKYLIDNYGGKLRSNVLKVAHHGSETSSTDAFIQEVKPGYAVVFAGCEYSLPKESVLQRYRDAGALILRTDEGDQGKSESSAGGDDNIVIKTDGKELEIIRR